MAQLKKATTKRRDPRKVHPALRNAVRAKVLATQDVCAICGLLVDKTLPQYDPMAPEIDEIIPVSRGGSPVDLDNLQLTHRRCNERKGNRMAGDPTNRSASDAPLPVSRNW